MDIKPLLERISKEKGFHPFCDLVSKLLPECMERNYKSAVGQIPGLDECDTTKYSSYKNHIKGRKEGTDMFVESGVSNIKMLESVMYLALTDYLRSEGAMYEFCNTVNERLPSSLGEEIEEDCEILMERYGIEGLELEETVSACKAIMSMITLFFSYKQMKKFTMQHITYMLWQTSRILQHDSDDFNIVINDIIEKVKPKKTKKVVKQSPKKKEESDDLEEIHTEPNSIEDGDESE